MEIPVLLWALLPLTFGGDFSKLDNVVYLTAQNFTEITDGGRWLVLFYFHSCGGCTRYQPFFSNFSVYLKDWNPLLKVGALDCELPENDGTCSSFTVVGVPDLRYLPAGRSVNDTGIVIGDEKESFIGLRNKLLNFLKREISLDGSRLSEHSKKLLTIISNIEQPVSLEREHDVTETRKRGIQYMPKITTELVLRESIGNERYGLRLNISELVSLDDVMIQAPASL
ncbi:thioredoxin [Opisthorchis viverrini]|uniref:Thioredoxin n=1 Tax=Opisthorchis viverrini TaxID=6198 RepID=A0A1S8X8I0_OPIVI|nr:thioredoxin [Opisthorchis viverrini]